MGMFNWVINIPEQKCRGKGCDAVLKGWQTKDGDNLFCEEVDYRTLTRFYTSCDVCKVWHEFVRPSVPVGSIEDFTLIKPYVDDIDL